MCENSMLLFRLTLVKYDLMIELGLSGLADIQEEEEEKRSSIMKKL